MEQKISQFSKVSIKQYEESVDFYNVKSIYQNIKLPKRATTGSAGYDFYSPQAFTLAPSETIKIATGIRVKMEEGWVLFMLPRSGHGFKFRIQLDNTVGVIDSDYYYSDNEGHIMLKFTNDGKNGKTMSVQVGEAIAQGVFLPFGITMDDNATETRNGGFGSTSKSK